jgi:cytochrome oxidase Cu insertion factor (SCO1/SenC/PrrC family)
MMWERFIRYLPIGGLVLGLTLWMGLALLNAQTRLVVNRDGQGRLVSVYTVAAHDASQSASPTKGRMFVYWPNGQLRVQAEFEHSVYVGELLEWHESGIPARRMQYALGREYGLQRGWRLDGGSDFAYEMRDGRRFGVPGTMPCVVDKGDRKQALARYLREVGTVSASAQTAIVTRVSVPELPLYNDVSLAPRWVRDGRVAEHVVNRFSLVDHRGVRFDPPVLAGHPTVVVFFFTGCTNLCPTTVAQMKGLEQRMQEKHMKDVRFVAVSATPLQDDVTALASYAKRFDLGAAWHLVTGDVESVEQFASHSFFAKTTGEVHTERAFLLDGESRIRGVYNVTQPSDMARLVQDAARFF